MHRRWALAVTLGFALLGSGLLGGGFLGGRLLAVGSGGSPPTARFDSVRAYALVERMLGYGPRPAGSDAERRVALLLRSLLPRGRFEPVPGGLRNVVGSLPGREPAILIGAHYDTTPVPGYVGANNSAAGVAAVVEIARALKADPRRRNLRAVRFALFDGEEAPAGFSDFYAEGARGSKAYVAADGAKISELILLDFIANRHLRIPREAGSDPALWARLRAAATAVGTPGSFPQATRPGIYDDHTPFARAGIPAIDLIDFDYPCWQKACDTLGAISRASLDASGRTVLALVRAERSR